MLHNSKNPTQSKRIGALFIIRFRIIVAIKSIELELNALGTPLKNMLMKSSDRKILELRFRSGTTFKMSRALVLLALIILAVADKQLKLYNTKCTASPKYVANDTCSIKMIARNEVVANVDFDLVLPLKNVTLYIRVLKFYNQFKPFLINDWVNLCKVLRSKGIFKLFITSFLNYVSNYSNVLNCHSLVII